jgi:hypothetical protein
MVALLRSLLTASRRWCHAFLKAHTRPVTTMSTDIAFADVPQPDPDAVVDPNWLRLRGDSLLPTLYMPPTMAGRRPTWMRAMAVVLIGVFLVATALGLCLTYGPPSAGW